MPYVGGKFVDASQPSATTSGTSGGLTINKDINSILQTAAILDLAKGGKNISKLSGISNLFPGPTETEQKETKRNKDIASAAKNYLDTYQSFVAKGDLNSDEAKRELSFAAGKYNSVAGFGEGGKTLTASELGILAPTLIKTQRQRDKNLFERALGLNPAMTKGLIQEDPAEAAEKMKLALKNTDPQLYAQYQNLVGNQMSQKKSSQMTAGSETLNPNIAENAVTNLVDIVKGIPQLGKKLLDFTPLPGMSEIVQGKPVDTARPFRTGAEIVSGVVNNLGQTIGVSKNEDGGFTWDPKAAFIHDYNHPIDTALWILPFVKGLKGAKGATATKASSAEAGILEQAASDASKTTKAGSAARGVATIIPESLVKSEELMSKALKYSKSNSVEGIARELETSIPKQTKIIENWAKGADSTIGAQPLDEIVSQVMEKVSNTTVARANPELLKTVENTLRRQLSTGELQGGFVRGEAEATNMSSINNARKYFTSGKDSWFNNGQPVGSPTNDLNALEWQTANGLKEIIAEADVEGIVKQALDRQHVAFETVPVLSKIVSKTKGINPTSLKWGLIRKAWEATGGKVVESAKIKNARELQGGTLEQILSKAPEESVQTVPQVNQSLPQAPVLQKKSLPEDIIQNMIQSKGAAQSTRLLRDMRYKQGNPAFRTIQDNILRMSGKRKYK